jgi:hypothetical protein
VSTFPTAFGPDHRLVALPFDRECHLGACRQALRLEAVREFLAGRIQDLHVLGDFRGPVLSPRVESHSALVGVDLLDGALDLERRHAAGADR